MDYDFRQIEEKWQNLWRERKTYKTEIDKSRPKYYVLDMFPYPSGAGLHVGHPLGYIASDVFARYKKLTGFNVLHPMGYDSFGLPAEQYAIQTGQHPAVTTTDNIKRYREQLDKIGFSYDWNRQVKTSSPEYYKWTQWIFLLLFDSWYNIDSDKAEHIDTLIKKFQVDGNCAVIANGDEVDDFSAAEWNSWDEKTQQKMLLNYRMTYIAESMVNWCPELGTVLAHDEIKDGKSERGEHPVFQKSMKQWSMRITAYAQRLLDGLNDLEWSDAIKEIQRNWIGRSEGASVKFQIDGHVEQIEVFTTRPDTIFGVTFMVLAPEHELVEKITTTEQRAEITAYKEVTSKRSERDRMSDVKTVSGVFTGAFVQHPFNDSKIPIWIGDYVLANYGTGAVMAVPAGDQRDWDFATKFDIDIIAVVEGQNITEGANDSKDGIMINSDFLNGMVAKDAIVETVKRIEAKKIGKGKINYRLRNAIFSRQRYWGEPIPIYYKDDTAYPMDLADLPVGLPEVDKYLPTETGDPPLGRAVDFKTKDGHQIETNTMPGWAGSSWYYLRYMDASNDSEFVSKEALDYWQQVDLYIGGAEHGTGHLLYFRFWTKFLYDMGYLSFQEPAKKLINQGMIQAEDGQKMSKRYGNVVNPDDIIAKYGGDTLRLYEMFLGPLEQHKPWDTKGIEGVHRFLRKYWRMFHDKDNNFQVSEEKATKEELKMLHKTIRKIKEDIERYSFNTVVSEYMICVNGLTDLRCNKREVLEQLVVLTAPYAPHISEELWEKLGNQTSVTGAKFPVFEASYLVENAYKYPVSFNGKMRFILELPTDLSKEEIEQEVLNSEESIKWLEGKIPKRIIVVPQKIVNIVL